MYNVMIKDARPPDLEDVYQLNQANLPHVGAISLSDMASLYNQAVYFRVAKSGEKIAGFLIAFDPHAGYKSPNYLWFKKHFEAFIYIDRIIIASEFRGKGLAFDLYKDLEQFACARGIPILACEYNLRPQNETSRIFHRQYGFKEVGRQETEGGKKTVSLQIKQIG